MEDIFLKQYELEKSYHFRILNEKNELLREKIYKDAYSEIFSFFREYFPHKEFFGSSIAMVDRFKELFHDRIVVDYGCGYGVTTIVIAKYAKLAIGVEVAPELVRKAEKNAKTHNINAEFYTIEKFEKVYKDNSIDIFFSVDVAEHLHPDDLRVHLNKSYNKLKKGGCYILITPHRFHGPHDISKSFLPKGADALGLHLKEYTYKELNEMFKQASFSQVKALLTYYGIGKLMKKFNLSIAAFFVNVYHKIFLEMLLPRTIYYNKHAARLLKVDSIWIMAYKGS